MSYHQCFLCGEEGKDLPNYVKKCKGCGRAGTMTEIIQTTPEDLRAIQQGRNITGGKRI